MAFRNEEAALRARIEVLERELASLRDVAEERDRLKERIEQLEKQLGFDEERKRRAAEERETARARARRERSKRVRGWVKAIGGPRVPQVIGGVLLAGGVLWGGTRVICGPSHDAAPSVGMIDLDAEPAPALPRMHTRGWLGTPSGCSGFVPSAPQLVLRASTPVSLRIAPEATSSGDLVLMVVGPDGRVVCDDDGGDSMNPLVTTVMPAGDTRVWVGSYEGGNGIEFTLSITAAPTAAAPDESGLASTAPATAGVVEGPDARRVLSGTATSITAASSLDSGCRGFLPIEPQAELRLSGEAAVRLHARSPASHDLVLLVRSPDGTLTCDDDSGPGNEPMIATLLHAGVHRVWIGTYSQRAEPYAFSLDASALAIPRDVAVDTRRLGTEDLTVTGMSRDQVSPTAIGASCTSGLVGVVPDVALQLDAPGDVVLAIATGGSPFAVVTHPDGSSECLTTALTRRVWSAGAHRVYVGVPRDGTPGPFTLTARALPSSVRPWSPR